jgi:hypothetical protein
LHRDNRISLCKPACGGPGNIYNASNRPHAIKDCRCPA